jgi:hypothetical protein
VWHLKIQKTADFKQSSDAPGEAPGVLHVLKNMKRRDDLKPLPDLAIEKVTGVNGGAPLANFGGQHVE